jgi:hypothetical protein
MAEVFSGTTPHSLGYVTQPVKPTMGKTVRIELSNAIKENDERGLVEVTGKKLAEPFSGRSRKRPWKSSKPRSTRPRHNPRRVSGSQSP